MPSTINNNPSNSNSAQDIHTQDNNGIENQDTQNSQTNTDQNSEGHDVTTDMQGVQASSVIPPLDEENQQIISTNPFDYSDDEEEIDSTTSRRTSPVIDHSVEEIIKLRYDLEKPVTKDPAMLRRLATRILRKEGILRLYEEGKGEKRPGLSKVDLFLRNQEINLDDLQEGCCSNGCRSFISRLIDACGDFIGRIKLQRVRSAGRKILNKAMSIDTLGVIDILNPKDFNHIKKAMQEYVDKSCKLKSYDGPVLQEIGTRLAAVVITKEIIEREEQYIVFKKLSSLSKMCDTLSIVEKAKYKEAIKFINEILIHLDINDGKNFCNGNANEMSGVVKIEHTDLSSILGSLARSDKINENFVKGKENSRTVCKFITPLTTYCRRTKKEIQRLIDLDSGKRSKSPHIPVVEFQLDKNNLLGSKANFEGSVRKILDHKGYINVNAQRVSNFLTNILDGKLNEELGKVLLSYRNNYEEGDIWDIISKTINSSDKKIIIHSNSPIRPILEDEGAGLDTENDRVYFEIETLTQPEEITINPNERPIDLQLQESYVKSIVAFSLSADSLSQCKTTGIEFHQAELSYSLRMTDGCYLAKRANIYSDAQAKSKANKEVERDQKSGIIQDCCCCCDSDDDDYKDMQSRKIVKEKYRDLIGFNGLEVSNPNVRSSDIKPDTSIEGIRHYGYRIDDPSQTRQDIFIKDGILNVPKRERPKTKYVPAIDLSSSEESIDIIIHATQNRLHFEEDIHQQQDDQTSQQGSQQDQDDRRSDSDEEGSPQPIHRSVSLISLPRTERSTPERQTSSAPASRHSSTRSLERPLGTRSRSISSQYLAELERVEATGGSEEGAVGGTEERRTPPIEKTIPKWLLKELIDVCGEENIEHRTSEGRLIFVALTPEQEIILEELKAILAKPERPVPFPPIHPRPFPHEQPGPGVPTRLGPFTPGPEGLQRVELGPEHSYFIDILGARRSARTNPTTGGITVFLDELQYETLGLLYGVEDEDPEDQAKKSTTKPIPTKPPRTRRLFMDDFLPEGPIVTVPEPKPEGTYEIMTKAETSSSEEESSEKKKAPGFKLPSPFTRRGKKPRAEDEYKMGTIKPTSTSSEESLVGPEEGPVEGPVWEPAQVTLPPIEGPEKSEEEEEETPPPTPPIRVYSIRRYSSSDDEGTGGPAGRQRLADQPAEPVQEQQPAEQQPAEETPAEETPAEGAPAQAEEAAAEGAAAAPEPRPDETKKKKKSRLRRFFSAAKDKLLGRKKKKVVLDLEGKPILEHRPIYKPGPEAPIVLLEEWPEDTEEPRPETPPKEGPIWEPVQVTLPPIEEGVEEEEELTPTPIIRYSPLMRYSTSSSDDEGTGGPAGRQRLADQPAEPVQEQQPAEQQPAEETPAEGAPAQAEEAAAEGAAAAPEPRPLPPILQHEVVIKGFLDVIEEEEEELTPTPIRRYSPLMRYSTSSSDDEGTGGPAGRQRLADQPTEQTQQTTKSTQTSQTQKTDAATSTTEGATAPDPKTEDADDTKKSRRKQRRRRRRRLELGLAELMKKIKEAASAAESLLLQRKSEISTSETSSDEDLVRPETPPEEGPVWEPAQVTLPPIEGPEKSEEEEEETPPASPPRRSPVRRHSSSDDEGTGGPAGRQRLADQPTEPVQEQQPAEETPAEGAPAQAEEAAAEGTAAAPEPTTPITPEDKLLHASIADALKKTSEDLLETREKVLERKKRLEELKLLRRKSIGKAHDSPLSSSEESLVRPETPPKEGPVWEPAQVTLPPIEGPEKSEEEEEETPPASPPRRSPVRRRSSSDDEGKGGPAGRQRLADQPAEPVQEQQPAEQQPAEETPAEGAPAQAEEAAAEGAAPEPRPKSPAKTGETVFIPIKKPLREVRRVSMIKKPSDEDLVRPETPPKEGPVWEPAQVTLPPIEGPEKSEEEEEETPLASPPRRSPVRRPTWIPLTKLTIPPFEGEESEEEEEEKIPPISSPVSPSTFLQEIKDKISEQQKRMKARKEREEERARAAAAACRRRLEKGKSKKKS